MSNEQEQLWQRLLDSDLNRQYWYILSRRYYLRSRLIKLFTILFAGLTFIVLYLDFSQRSVSLILAGLTTILSTMGVFFQFEEIQTRARILAKEWAGLNHSYEKLWSTTSGKDIEILQKELEALRKIELEITSNADFLPRKDLKLIQDIYQKIVGNLDKVNSDTQKEG